MSVYSVSVGMDGISGELMSGDRAEKVRAILIERAEHDAELADLLRHLGFINAGKEADRAEDSKAPDGWVGFHPDDPARLREFRFWLDQIDKLAEIIDKDYIPSDAIQLDVERIAKAIEVALDKHGE